MLAGFGPAAIVASVSIGAGETIVVVRAGAWARYGRLWLVLLSCVVKGIFVTYLLGRYTAVSGSTSGIHWCHFCFIHFAPQGTPLSEIVLRQNQGIGTLLPRIVTSSRV